MSEKPESFQLQEAGHFQREKDRIEAEKRKVQQKMLDLETAALTADSRLLRAQNQLPDSGVCPRCWIWDGARTPLKPTTGTDEIDRFLCLICGHAEETPIT